jgi:hypothetical protein
VGGDLLGDHDGGEVGVGADHLRDHRAVDDVKVVDAANTAVRVAVSRVRSNGG